MTALGVDAVYVNSAENHLYLSGFYNPDGWLLVTMKSLYLFADFRYIEAAKNEASPACTICEPGKTLHQEIIRDEDIHSIGYEDRCMTCAALEELRRSVDGMNVGFVPLGGMFSEIRAVKSADEVDAIIEAQHIAEAAFDHILTVLSPEMTEIEVAAELEYFMKKHGSERPSFDTIAVSGSASSRPHGVPRAVKLERGFLTMDFGAVVRGYHSDMTRTVVVGKTDAEMRRLYDTVLLAQTEALAAIAAGKKNADIDGIARNIINSAGYEGCFGHSLGHGVGLEIHEFPNLSPRSGDAILQVGNVVTVEPGIYIVGKYGCRIEDLAFVENYTCKHLTSSPKDLIEIL